MYMSHIISFLNQPIIDPRRILFSHTTANITQNFAFETCPPSSSPIGFLCKRIYSKIIVSKSPYQAGRDIVEGVKFIFTWRYCADVVE
jgi:hypothetical protein